MVFNPNKFPLPLFNGSKNEGKKKNLEELEKRMDTFVRNFSLDAYGGGKGINKRYFSDIVEKLNVRMILKPLEKMNVQSKTKFGEYQMDPDRAGTDYIEKKEIPKIRILTKDENELKQFLSGSKYMKAAREVRKFVVKKYGKNYRIPDMEDLQYISSLPVDKIPSELKEGDLSFFGSIVCDVAGDPGVPCLYWNKSYEDDVAKFHSSIRPCGTGWSSAKIILIEKQPTQPK